MTVLQLALSDTPLRHEWAHLRTSLRRGAKTPEGKIALEAYRPASLRAARAAWARRLAAEHRSATVFSGLLPQLIEAGAPLDFQAVVLRMAMEELRHGELCAAVVEALGGVAEVEVERVTEVVAEHADCTPRVRALRNVIYASCISETVSVSLTTAERGHTEEPRIAQVLDQLLGDEVLHARFGWLYLGVALPCLDASERAAVQAYLPFALQHYVERVAPSASGPVPDGEMRERLRLGVGPGELYAEILNDTLDEVVVPRLASFGLEVGSWR